MQMVFIINLACVAAESEACVQCGITMCKDNSSCVVSMPEWWAPQVKDELSETQDYRNLCCMCSMMGMTYFVNTFRLPLGDYEINFGAALYLFLANIVFAQICYQLGAMCGCCQARSWKTRRRAERMGHVLLIGILMVCFASMPIFLDYVRHNDLLLVSLTNFVVGKTLATIGTTAFQTCIFTFLWPKQEGATNYFVTEEDFTRYRSILEHLASAPEISTTPLLQNSGDTNQSTSPFIKKLADVPQPPF
jgi:hypothetical protein